ncbi:MAG: hypothetical protein H0X70_06635 [Segetibacter sp.]|jgi:hypothetical protein|nr:hypothetical protein [Segetibacter sp.]
MIKLPLKTLIAFAFLVTSCNNQQDKTVANNSNMDYQQGSFGYDLNFLQKHDSVVVLSSGETQVVVSPKYQAKVFTSTANGNEGQSFGWINYKAFTAQQDAHMNAYGGENRFWLGPEGGRYSLFFNNGKKMVFDNWKTPAPFDTQAWTVSEKNDRSVTMQKNMQLTNYTGTQLQLSANRTVTILNKQAVMDKIGLPIDTSVKVVGYRTDNTITNTGTKTWNETTGMPCIWMLDMFNPSAETIVVIPYKTDVNNATAKVATTDYFGEISADRIKYKNEILLFKADGKSRGKLGLAPKRAKPVAGSYDPLKGALTITLFDMDANGKYLNQEWNTAKPAFSGDAVNSYNDGPLQDGTQMGPFYEIESVSPAAFLAPGASLAHQHSVFHFTGNKEGLDKIAQKLLGISLNQISL